MGRMDDLWDWMELASHSSLWQCYRYDLQYWQTIVRDSLSQPLQNKSGMAAYRLPSQLYTRRLLQVVGNPRSLVLSIFFFMASNIPVSSHISFSFLFNEFVVHRHAVQQERYGQLSGKTKTRMQVVFSYSHLLKTSFDIQS